MWHRVCHRSVGQLATQNGMVQGRRRGCRVHGRTKVPGRKVLGQPPCRIPHVLWRTRRRPPPVIPRATRRVVVVAAVMLRSGDRVLARCLRRRCAASRCVFPRRRMDKCMDSRVAHHPYRMSSEGCVKLCSTRALRLNGGNALARRLELFVAPLYIVARTWLLGQPYLSLAVLGQRLCVDGGRIPCAKPSDNLGGATQVNWNIASVTSKLVSAPLALISRAGVCTTGRNCIARLSSYANA